MSEAARHQPSVPTRLPQQLWYERATTAIFQLVPRLAQTDVDLVVTLAIFSGVGLLASLILLLLDHQLNGQLPNL